MFYDKYCGVCSTTKDFFNTKEIAPTITFEPLLNKKFKKILKKKKLHFKSNNLYLVNKEGAIFTGTEAIFKILQNSTGYLRYIGMMGNNQILIKIIQPFYDLFAKNRFIVSKILHLIPDSQKI